MKKLYKVGIYCRLSVDDASNSAKAKNYIPADESVSIENQYELLSKFVMLNGWTEVKSYRDDGYSGGNFQRPGFLEMLEDARHGLINLILVKDLSRLGRDFVEVGRYTDVIFPSLGCRFVSVLDCLDTEGDNTDMLHFRSLMNDYHLKDLSNKVKSVLHAKMRSGQYIAAYAPYGYRKSAEDGASAGDRRGSCRRGTPDVRAAAGRHGLRQDRRCAEQRGHPVPTLVLGKAVRKRLLQVREPLDVRHGEECIDKRGLHRKSHSEPDRLALI